MSQSRGFSTTRLARLRSVMAAYVDRGEVAGLVALVSRHGTVHVEALGVQDLATGRPMQRDTIFRIASMSKPMTAAAAMILVEEARLRLDEPLDHLLPELADRKVLRRLDGPADDLVPAERALTLRDLLTYRLGLGAIMAAPGTYPIQRVIAEAGVAPGPMPPVLSPDDYMARIGGLPLLHQPGQRWHYHTGSDILGVLIARAAGKSLGDFLAERIFAPLGMRDTGFMVRKAARDRLASPYTVDPGTGRLAPFDDEGRWTRPPVFPSGSGGLVATADDFHAFARVMLALGRHGSERILARPTVELMTSDQLSADQKAASPFFPGFWDGTGWGFGVAVTTQADGTNGSPGSYGWDGGFGTIWRNDPREDLVAILLTQRMLTSPVPSNLFADFRTLVTQAIDN